MNRFGWEMTEHFVVTAIIFVIGRALQKRIGRGSERLRIHGTFVLWWCAACYFAGWFVALLDGVDSALGRSGGAGIGLLVGWLIGSLHGALVMWLRGAILRRTTLPSTPPEKDKS